MFEYFRQVIYKRAPSQCLVCNDWPGQAICESCVSRFARPEPRCETCALRVPLGVSKCGRCLVSPSELDRCFAAVPYEFPWAHLIRDFKFNQQAGLADTLSLLISSLPWVEPELDSADAIIPIPLSRARLRERGYNQSALLARALAPNKVLPSGLIRLKDAAKQSSSKRANRFENVMDAFAIDPLMAPRLRHRHVVLIDDVMTTGASLNSAAKVLRAAGIRRITGLVVARTDVHSA